MVGTHDSASRLPAKRKHSYFVRIINPKKKSDFVVRTWHDASETFDSPRSLKLKLMESFPDDVPDHVSFQVGYFEGKNSTKRWIVEPRDLQSMYSVLEEGQKITLWCEGKGRSSPVSKNDDSEPPPAKKAKQSATGTSKRESFEEEIDKIFTKLKEKHPDMPAPKLRLWARLIQSGQHDYENPPNIPLITGTPATTSKLKDSVAEALTSAATAVVKLLQPTQSNDSPSTPKTQSTGHSTYISPMKLAQLRRGCLEDLKKVKELLEEGVLTEQEYQEEKQQILHCLKNLK